MVQLLVIINNYLHDVATAMLISVGILILISYKLMLTHNSLEVDRFFRQLYAKYIIIAKCSLVWVVLSGVPRTIFFKKYELAFALGRQLIPALIIKHILMFALVIIGLFIWRYLYLEEKKQG